MLALLEGIRKQEEKGRHFPDIVRVEGNEFGCKLLNLEVYEIVRLVHGLVRIQGRDLYLENSFATNKNVLVL